MCGEHFTYRDGLTTLQGSSPHVRGARGAPNWKGTHNGIIPACAGSTKWPAMARRWTRDHPRMCGEHSTGWPNIVNAWGSSPHVRGAPVGAEDAELDVGIIPACAGSTMTQQTNPVNIKDHPRMCGEHQSAPTETVQCQGSSPHVRGAHFENSIIPRKRKDNWLFFIQFRFENFLAFRYLLALLHPFLGVPTKDPSFASLGRLINCNPSQSTGDQSAPYTLKAICCSFLAE